MPQNQPRRSEMWWRGHNDALAGDPPNESYYHYYYDYKLAYDQVRREQRRTRWQRTLSSFGRGLLIAAPVVLVLGYFGFNAWTTSQPTDEDQQAVVVPTSTPRPTPRPTLPPPTPTPEPALRPDSYAVITGTQGAALRARSKPGLKEVTVTRYREGQTVHVLEGPQVVDNLEWWRVEADGIGGWAAGTYLKPIEASSPPPP
ncbi:MAG: SH3 domain-containing protein [Chloroflexota bacterium]|nr:SH3 domain-containing protein [Chloroflexota bacterium]